MSLSKAHYLLLSTGSTEEDPSRHDMTEKLLTGMLSIKTNKQGQKLSYLSFVYCVNLHAFLPSGLEVENLPNEQHPYCTCLNPSLHMHAHLSIWVFTCANILSVNHQI